MMLQAGGNGYNGRTVAAGGNAPEYRLSDGFESRLQRSAIEGPGGFSSFLSELLAGLLLKK
jgi:hypothetical protein